ncbi:unnamed protein product [Chondrus crispus]|uniref:Uncharacterized protein n=1 Tax=Chondrus crispus TaxID=2769 RepID=R7QLX3_CHOCR|nr:unnamed protein product [Chondrus crispus]CDF38783.1 unnamed protein product [Chondrus crispus]|eukprot:XP_005718688.1 unnamed protein product [Chondrus crispus]
MLFVDRACMYSKCLRCRHPSAGISEEKEAL